VADGDGTADVAGTADIAGTADGAGPVELVPDADAADGSAEGCCASSHSFPAMAAKSSTVIHGRMDRRGRGGRADGTIGSWSERDAERGGGGGGAAEGAGPREGAAVRGGGVSMSLSLTSSVGSSAVGRVRGGGGGGGSDGGIERGAPGGAGGGGRDDSGETTASSVRAKPSISAMARRTSPRMAAAFS
jgi:hypothetical protein